MRKRNWLVVVAMTAACGDGSARPEKVRVPAATTGGGGGQGSSLATAPARRTVLIVGTSLTAGLGLDPEDAYPALLQRLADSAGVAVEIVNAGVSGETSAGALRRIGWLLRQRVDVLVLETGANDGLRGLDIDSTRANLRAIVGEVKRAQPGATILLVQMEAPPNLGARYTRDFHAMFEQVARSEQIGLLPFLLRDVAGRDGLNQADGIHPNEAGSRLVAKTLWPPLENVLRR